jgi:hypothetical protein
MRLLKSLTLAVIRPVADIVPFLVRGRTQTKEPLPLGGLAEKCFVFCFFVSCFFALGLPHGKKTNKTGEAQSKKKSNKQKHFFWGQHTTPGANIPPHSPYWFIAPAFLPKRAQWHPMLILLTRP